MVVIMVLFVMPLPIGVGSYQFYSTFCDLYSSLGQTYIGMFFVFVIFFVVSYIRYSEYHSARSCLEIIQLL